MGSSGDVFVPRFTRSAGAGRRALDAGLSQLMRPFLSLATQAEVRQATSMDY